METNIKNKMLEIKRVCAILIGVDRGDLNIIAMLLETKYNEFILGSELKDFIVERNKEGEFWFGMVETIYNDHDLPR